MKIDDFPQFGIAACLALTCLVAPQKARSEQQLGASFVERFEAIEQSRWLISDGWTNGEHQNCTWSGKNLHAGEHGVELTLKDAPQTAGAPAKLPFTCAEIQTHEVFGYGTYEVRMRAARPPVPGLVSAFFTYIGPTQEALSPHDEIDFEFVGKNARAVEVNFFAEGKGEHSKVVELDFDASETMADYAFEWLPDRIRWYVNGAFVHEAVRAEGSPFPSTPGKILLSVWSGHGLEQWLGSFEYPGKPLTARYELVAFTKAGEACQFPASIVCKLNKRADQRP